MLKTHFLFPLCLALLASTHAATAQTRPIPGWRPNPTPQPTQIDFPLGLNAVDKEGKIVQECPLKRTAVQADIAGTISRVSVRQRFSNTSKEPIEAIYTFPLPHDAAVDGMRFTVGERVIRGEIKRREEAKAIYDAAKNAGRSAALLDQERPNIFTQRVANLMPGHDIVVEINFVQPIPYKAGKYEWVFPTVVGPRYTPTGGYQKPGERGAPSGSTPPAADTKSVVEDAEKITPPITPKGLKAGHDILLTANLVSPVPLGEVSSSLHEIQVKREGDLQAAISLKKDSELPNRDFVLRWKPRQNEVQTGLVTHASGNGGYFSLVLQPPPAAEKTSIAPKEMVFVIDQTGSQRGLPIQKAKETMRHCINNLNPNDTFQLLGFTTQVHPCFEKPVPVNEANIQAALKYLEPIEGNGGTDILKAIDYVLRIPDDPGRARVVGFMTDGFIGNETQILQYISQHGDRAKIFPFGVGNSVNRFLIDGMAREGRGTAEYVLLNEEGDAAAKRFYNRVANPLLVNIGINWGNLPVQDVLPGGIPDLYESGPIVLTGRYKKPASGNITLTGMLGERPWRKTVHLDFPEKSEGGEALPSLWARQRITDIEAQAWRPTSGEKPRDTKEEITQLALEYKLMSQYTSFVAVESKVVNEGGKQRTVDVPVEMADGVSYEGIFDQPKRAMSLTRGGGGFGGGGGGGVGHLYAGGLVGGGGFGGFAAPSSPTTNVAGTSVMPPLVLDGPRLMAPPMPGPVAAIDPQNALLVAGTPEEKKQQLRRQKLTAELLALLGNRDAKSEVVPAGVQVQDGLVKIEINHGDLKPEIKTALFAKIKTLGLVELVEISDKRISGRLPVAKLDELLALPEIVQVVAGK